MSPATVALLEQVQRRPDVARARSRLVRFGAPDPGYALARITARNMVEALVEEVGEQLDAGQVPTVEAHPAAAAVATSGRPARHGRPTTPSPTLTHQE